MISSENLKANGPSNYSFLKFGMKKVNVSLAFVAVMIAATAVSVLSVQLHGQTEINNINLAFETGNVPSKITPKVLGAKITNGLVGQWSFEEGTGTSTVDGSGNSLTGTLVGSPTWTTGNDGKAIQFANGKSVNIDDRSFGNVSWSTAAWIKTSGTSGWIIGNAEGSDMRIAEGKLLAQLYTSTGFKNVYSTSTVNNNSWRHVAMTVTSDTIRLYIDGVLDKTETFTGTTNMGFDSIGARIDNSASGFTGLIDEVYIFNRTISGSEVQTLATTTSSTDTTAPTVSVTAPTANASVTGTVTLTATATDNVSVTGVQFKIDGTNFGTEDITSPYSVSLNSTTLTNASHSLTAVARDGAGNSTTSSVVTFTATNANPEPTPTPTGCPTAGGVNSFVGCYFKNKDFTDFYASRTDAAINFSWAANTSPYPGISFGNSTYSVRWLGTHSFEAATYEFSVTSDDGIRLYIDNVLLINEWTDRSSTTVKATKAMTAGAHEIKVEYYNNFGKAVAKASWVKKSVTPTPTPDTTPPTVSITAPASGATISGTSVITTSTSDNVGVVGVQFKVDGQNIGGEVTTSPFSANFNTTTVSNGTHSLTAVARDAAGNTTTSSVLSVTVNNTVQPPVNAPPTGSLDGVRTTDNMIYGWARDPDNLNVPVQVHLYFDGPTTGTPLVVTASDNRSDVGNHAFNVAVPTQYRNSLPHTVYAYAIDLTDTTGASNRLLAGSPKTFTITSTQPVPTTACTGSSCVNVNSAVTYQTIDGWEATSWAGQEILTGWGSFTDSLITKAVNDLGINRVRLEILSGAENTVDNWQRYKDCGNTVACKDQWRAGRYNAVNDNTNSNLVNAAGFQYAEFDDTIEHLVIPLRQKLQARGEQLYLNVNYVDFTGSTGMHAASPAEYAEFVLNAYQHMQTKYGFVPDSWEVVLEPDNTGTHWTPVKLAAGVKAAGDRLAAAGYTPRFVAPSVTNASNAVSYIDALANTSGAMQYVDTFSYHLYGGQSVNVLQSIANKATTYNKKTAQLEFIGADYRNLHTDLTIGKNSSWAQYTFGGPGSDDGGGYFYVTGSTVNLSERSKFLAQYFKYVRKGAQRISAVNSGNPFIDPIAFKNTDGKHVVISTIVGAPNTQTFGINGLPAGTYGIFYTSGNPGSTTQLADQSIGAGSAVTVTLPAGTVGVVTVYAKTTSGNVAQVTQPAPVLPTIPSEPTANVTLVPGDSDFKYASSPTIYFLNKNSQKEVYTESSVFLAWNTNFNSVVTIPDSQTYPDGGTVRLPQNSLVKESTLPTIYLVDGITIRPFASLSALVANGYSTSKVITVDEKYLDSYTVGATIN